MIKKCVGKIGTSIIVLGFLSMKPINMVFAAVAPPTTTVPAAQCDGCFTVQSPFGGLSVQTILSGIISRVTAIFLFTVGVILIAYFLYGGYMYMVDGGNEESVKKSKQIMTSAAIGIAIIGFAGVIATLMQNILGINLGI